jgi:phenylpyruvate tautomerase PptA (4-oxalocrotonate tautomerase family)
MPLIQCHLSKPLPADRRQRLMDGLVEATIRTLGADPRTITIVLQEHDAGNVRELGFAPAEQGKPGG